MEDIFAITTRESQLMNHRHANALEKRQIEKRLKPPLNLEKLEIAFVAFCIAIVEQVIKNPSEETYKAETNLLGLSETEVNELSPSVLVLARLFWKTNQKGNKL
jgi:hypothetical protein